VGMSDALYVAVGARVSQKFSPECEMERRRVEDEGIRAQGRHLGVCGEENRREVVEA
jgi:hypothetical protein